MIVIVDYGMGNLRSVRHAVEAAGAPATVTGDPATIETAKKIILPGVGAFGAAMRELDRRGLVPALKRHIAAGKPFLGICLGYQLLFEESDEAPEVKGLGVFQGRVIGFPFAQDAWTVSRGSCIAEKPDSSSGASATRDSRPTTHASGVSATRDPRLPSVAPCAKEGLTNHVLKVPHMGWSPVAFRKSHPSLAGIPDNTYFYFVHSFFPAPADASLVAGEAVYGKPFAAMIAAERLIATQFHPEKSADRGLRLLQNFIQQE